MVDYVANAIKTFTKMDSILMKDNIKKTLQKLQRLVKESKKSSEIARIITDAMKNYGAEIHEFAGNKITFKFLDSDDFVRITIEESFIPSSTQDELPRNNKRPQFFVLDVDNYPIYKPVYKLVFDVMREPYGHTYASHIDKKIDGKPLNARKLQAYFDRKYPEGLKWNAFKEVLKKLKWENVIK